MILLTNDDGIYSRGIRTLYRTAVSVFGKKEIAVIAPSGSRSASGMSLTFHKPLRIERAVIDGMEGLAVSGTPADCIFSAVYSMYKHEKIDMILSGINIGSNASIQAIESSGTVSAVKFGAILGIKGIAISLATDMGVRSDTYDNTGEHLARMFKQIKKNGFPLNVDILNVNVPADINRSTKWRICDMEDSMFNNYLIKKKDPRNNIYYWLWGGRKKRLTKGTDCDELFNKHALTISPMEIVNISKDLKRETAASLKYAEIV